MSSRVESIDASRRLITFAGGQELRYEQLINTAPLRWLCRTIGDASLSAAETPEVVNGACDWNRNARAAAGVDPKEMLDVLPWRELRLLQGHRL